MLSLFTLINQNHWLLHLKKRTAESGAAHSDRGGSPNLLYFFLLLPTFCLCSSLKERAGPPVPLFSPVLWTPQLSFSCPLTSSTPNLTDLCLCSSLWLAAGLGHTVLRVGCVDFFSLSLIFCSPKFSFFPHVSVHLIQLFTLSSPHSCLFARSPILGVLFPFFTFFYSSCFYSLRQTRNQCVNISSGPIYVCVCVCVFRYRHTPNMILIMELIEFSRASKVHSAAECLACLVCICWCFLCVCACAHVCACFDNINKISVCVASLCTVL